MQALIKISDKQYLVKEGDKLFIPRQKAEVGETVAIASIAKIDGENTVLTPSGSSIQARVLDHVKDDKVVVFKKKRRKRYQSRNG
ncbi:MAG: 50S ribosomal protein L21, partial [Chlorobiaceae bacterium]|nr:50S ribosomal protein L21 [Chlorobiaceae bacterium]